MPITKKITIVYYYSRTESDSRNFTIVTAQQQPQPNNKTTITVVELRQSNRWEYHHVPPQTQNYMIEQK